MTTNNKYRFDQYGSVYEYDENNNAYIFIGKLLGRTHQQFIEDYEEIKFNYNEEY